MTSARLQQRRGRCECCLTVAAAEAAGLEAVAFPAGLEDLIEEYGREDDPEDRDEECEGGCDADVLHHSRAAPV